MTRRLTGTVGVSPAAVYGIVVVERSPLSTVIDQSLP